MGDPNSLDAVSHRHDDILTSPGCVVLRRVQELCKLNGFLRPFDCSAKTGEKVQRIITTIAFQNCEQKEHQTQLESSFNAVIAVL